MNNNIKYKKKLYLIYTVCGSKEDAKKLGILLVRKKKAVCINILDNMLRIYKENENIIESQECVLLIKTFLKSKDLFKLINAKHKYKTPFIAKIKIKKTNNSYLKWAEKKLL